MELERKALYNSLRMNWQQDQSLDVEPWQVEDYRVQETEALFAGLEELDVDLSQDHFVAFAEEFETPEELAASLYQAEDAKREDRIYLLLFELWRRLLPERRALSIFCDELDHRIEESDRNQEGASEAIQDILAELQEILDESCDEGLEPEEVFAALDRHCANDLRSFLYDLIADELTAGDTSYAAELLEGFGHYLGDDEWFHFLQVQLWYPVDPEQAEAGLAAILDELATTTDTGLYLEILEFLARQGDRSLFVEVAHKMLPLLETEGDLVDFLSHCADYYERLDQEAQLKAIEKLLAARIDRRPNGEFDQQDPILQSLKSLLSVK